MITMTATYPPIPKRLFIKKALQSFLIDCLEYKNGPRSNKYVIQHRISNREQFSEKIIYTYIHIICIPEEGGWESGK